MTYIFVGESIRCNQWHNRGSAMSTLEGEITQGERLEEVPTLLLSQGIPKLDGTCCQVRNTTVKDITE